MTLPLSQALKVRAMVYVAGEAIPNFWPMRSFIHHNPLHGLEHLPFAEGVARGNELFHARGFLSRAQYQRYLATGAIAMDALTRQVAQFCAGRTAPEGVDLPALLTHLLTRIETPAVLDNRLVSAADIAHRLLGNKLEAQPADTATLRCLLHEAIDDTRPVHEAVDALYATDIGDTLNDLLVKSCLDFFDEEQSAWGMPGRELGLYRSWRQLALHNLRFKLRGLHIERIIARAEAPETMIVRIMEELQVPEHAWVGYFTRELTRLHGWAGFIRWRSRTKHYHWQQQHPADLVDLLALRLSLSLALLQDYAKHLPGRDLRLDAEHLRTFIDGQTERAFLQHELHGGHILPEFALEVDETLAGGSAAQIAALCGRYTAALHDHELSRQIQRLYALARGVGLDLRALPAAQLTALIELIGEFERDEGMLWLRAMEASAMHKLLPMLDIQPPAPVGKRPFAQALFCIDTRSEPIRRQLESIGDYQTYGIAGFFGVPMSFVELGKGSEAHLCPAVVTPKNLTLEMSIDQIAMDHALGALEHALHELKASVVAPFATVEAIGLIFGFDMFGKTLAPTQYNRWRRHLEHTKPATRLLLDKLTREQADSIVRAVQRALIVVALKQEFHLTDEVLLDNAIRELREAALQNQPLRPELASQLGVTAERLTALLQRLRTHYRINQDEVTRQMEQLSRLGFSLREQTVFVATALSSIGLTDNFSRFVLLIGHGSTSQNNPYESALDCGACGGNNGLTNSRALAYMANKAEVRAQLREQGIDIPNDTWFVPAMHNTTTDEIVLHEVELLPAQHLLYVDRLRKGLRAASRLCAQERAPTLSALSVRPSADAAERLAQRNALDWSQVRPEWGLARNAYFIIGRRELSQHAMLEGRSFLHSYDWRIDPKRRLLENILTGPLVVAEWINMEHYFSAVDNEHYGSGSKAYHNVAGRFGVMSGNIGDLRTGLPAQTVLKDGRPYHEPLRLINLIEAPFEHALAALNAVASVKGLVYNGWVRLMILDPETGIVHIFDDARQEWTQQTAAAPQQESIAS
ncbi:DUF2309 domain-containing protein [Acidihalobacter ferrooxydans]|uniref:Probable inorganic carbon transporter subunit DabA n=1 Tax=Acidihalobacter ferrooxydans TaxID=1765967 RepID=A0A1P8UF17_9GAMM|nr:DUF2309 domain-containing protein [Acidihalobacter ferrooxydans]APZ42364.1 DUF2309 domain-containing protein [Acidihalobacter ferrooxydans]